IPAQIAPFRIGAAARPLAAPAPPAHKAPDAPDRRMAERLRRGKEGPEARIDLHGLTLAEAHPALVAFIVGAHAAGLRVVLVITGKGRDRDEGGPIPTPRGVLRHHLPRWLAQPPLARIVQTATPSHHRHGGEGAWYVWLRRARPDPRGRTG
ncbi:MAG: DNA mismatch repair protein MutS, partial [Alphaproteobacteria bacterium]|nr:DNA mismatch repair protein MutS [Alphaproteobacteria bacterium]